MAVSVVTVVNNDSVVEAIVNKTEVIEVANTRNLLMPGSATVATEVVRPGGTVANVAWGPELPALAQEGQIFVLTQDPVVPSRTYVSDTDPGLQEPGIWWQTLPNGDVTLWIEDGE